MRCRAKISLIVFSALYVTCAPPSEKAYEKSFALRAARELDSIGDDETALYYLLRAKGEAAAKVEAENFLRLLAERKTRASGCIEDKKADLAINQYPRIRHKHLFQMGLCLEALGDTKRALNFYNLSETASSKQPQLFIRRALLEERLGDNTAAARDFARALALNPQYPPALLSQILFHLRRGNSADAEALLKPLAETKATYAEIANDVRVHRAEVVAIWGKTHGK